MKENINENVAVEFVRESNRIEAIYRAPSTPEIEAFHAFIDLDVVTCEDLEKFVSVYEPGAGLREKAGQDVRIGRYIPPLGGSNIGGSLVWILRQDLSPFERHCEYEQLHPFTDCNGRSGRMLWAWQMMKEDTYPRLDLGFLHAFYYQTLSAG